MRSPIAIAVVTAAAISLATLAQADACSDYRLALAARDAANQLLNERMAAGYVGGTPEKRPCCNCSTKQETDVTKRSGPCAPL